MFTSIVNLANKDNGTSYKIKNTR